jgi:uncharacterized protein (TIGR02271 family)
VFDDYSTAEQVARDLTNEGIDRGQIEVQSNFRTGAAGRTGASEAENEGGISGFFHRLFGGDDESGHYAEAVRRGSAVVCLTATESEIQRATQIMNEHGAIDIDRRASAYQDTGYERHDPDAPQYSYEEARSERERLGNRGREQSIPVVEEELQVGKRVVRKGGVRVYSRTTEQPVHEEVTLREDHVRVERRPADRPLQPGEASRLRDQTIEVEEMAEEAVVQKRARVREEVVIGKETTERTQRIDDTVRRTEVKVDQLGRDYADDFRSDYETNYASLGQPYSVYEPAYQYGYRMASDPRYHGRDWEDVEAEIGSAYSREYPQSAWERMKNAVRYGWDRMTGRRS